MSSTQKTAHTAAPWDADIEDVSVSFLHRAVIGPSGQLIADCYSDDMPGEESAANARLMAAAPEMLAALQLLHKWFDITGSSIRARWDRIPDLDRKAIVDATRAAIAKAEDR